jgi:hypothetical protein
MILYDAVENMHQIQVVVTEGSSFISVPMSLTNTSYFSERFSDLEPLKQNAEYSAFPRE